MGDKGRQDPKEADTPLNKGKQAGVQWETKGDKTLGKADTHKIDHPRKGTMAVKTSEVDTTQEQAQWGVKTLR